VLATLRSRGVAAGWLEIRRDTACLEALVSDPPDLAVLCVTEEVPIQGVLDMLGIPYNGSGPAPTAISLDKVVSRETMRAWGIATPRYAIVEHPGSTITPEGVRRCRARADLSYPIVVKPRSSGCSLGVRCVMSDVDAAVAVAGAARHSDDVLLEEYVEGAEVTVGMVGEDMLAPVCITPFGDVYDPSAKWRHVQPDKRSAYAARPDPRIDAEILRGVGDRLKRALSLRNAWRFDAIVRDDGSVVVLEVNALPKLAGPSGEMAWAAKASGVDHYGLLSWIASDALSHGSAPLDTSTAA
jgi:D-alanine-D-alanine ligase